MLWESVHLCRPRDPEAKGLTEWNNGYFETSFLPGAPLDVIAGKENVVFLGQPGTGKTHLTTGVAIRACQAGHRVLFATAAEWVDRLAQHHAAGRLQDELRRLGRYPLLVIAEVGYIPFEHEA